MSANNFKDIYFDYVYNQGEDMVNINFSMIFFIHSGKLIIECEDKKIAINKGKSVFLHHGTKVCLCKENCGAESFCGIYIGFSESMLSEIHNSIIFKKKYQPECIDDNIVQLPCIPCIQRLYISVATYLEWGVKPSEYIVELKQQEGIFSLLLVDEKFYNSLFDSIKKTQSYQYFIKINKLKN
ncbi:hypothetical protein [uncultured Apibacter sp.]|uniref:hypothetical protein n=1 Tax=uncultured Apibacter sp. TaxID=1778616 RepID=UPI002600B000|nr:hypothetical protein [uncultured Apibacter sp.]